MAVSLLSFLHNVHLSMHMTLYTYTAHSYANPHTPVIQCGCTGGHLGMWPHKIQTKPTYPNDDLLTKPQRFGVFSYTVIGENIFKSVFQP